jgi:hypothetical protein
VRESLTTPILLILVQKLRRLHTDPDLSGTNDLDVNYGSYRLTSRKHHTGFLHCVPTSSLKPTWITKYVVASSE